MIERVHPRAWLFVALTACGDSPAEHGHSHGDGGHDGASHEEEAESIAVTRWTTDHELFVELDAPVVARAFAYHAHVTRLADNHAATAGVLTLRFEQDGFVVETHTDEAVARPGIFAAEAQPPSTAGDYRLFFTYTNGDEKAEWDGGTVRVGDGVSVAHDGESDGEIGFLKESQWQVPFAVAPAQARPLAPLVQAAGVVRSAPASTVVVAAPVDGLVAWADVLPVVGRRVHRGDRLATLVPAGAAEHWTTLQAELSTARIDRDLARSDLARLEGLATGELASAKRLDEARAALARTEARAAAGRRRVSALTSAGAGAVSIRAPADGVIVAVGSAHGQAVLAGAPLVSVSTDNDVLIEGWVNARAGGALSPVASVSVMRGDWPAPQDLLGAGASVLTDQLVYDPRSLSASLSVLAPAASGLVPGDLVELAIGVGTPTPRLAVPRKAIVEINGQDIIFVQKTGESFTRRRVTLGAGDATHVEITDGLVPGEMVVVDGGFDVHVASLSGALESHRH